MAKHHGVFWANPLEAHKTTSNAAFAQVQGIGCLNRKAFTTWETPAPSHCISNSLLLIFS